MGSYRQTPNGDWGEEKKDSMMDKQQGPTV